ncbi:PadR family transcriptional regulator [Leifsonia aquatica]|uniref:PadR family transcriptional regulator n=1 Tax=Leifsonia aquatica TaxID=144185 RepID=UPI0009DF07FD|nr:helix-turn-helix transcriptional regulator [Leifsonia aquatica]
MHKSYKLTALDIMVLATLFREEGHPYDIFRRLQNQEPSLVRVRAATVYHSVERLTRYGLVVSGPRERHGNRPSRTVYRITSEGQLCLKSELETALSVPEEVQVLFPLALEYASQVIWDDIPALLGQRLDTLSRRIAELSASEPINEESLQRDYLLTMLKAQESWIQHNKNGSGSALQEW